MVSLLPGHAPVGWLELDPKHLDAGDLELGYRLLPEYWGQGLAAEAGRELIRFAFENPHVSRVTAETMFVNTPSSRVMEKLGMRHVRTWHEEFVDPLPGIELGEVEYAITREEWLSLRRT